MFGESIDLLAAIATLAVVFVSFTISASAGLGGSLLLVPTLALILGTKEGVALAALLLASNNVAKIVAYRKTLPFRVAAVVVIMIVVGAALGASLLVKAPSRFVAVGIIVTFALSMLAERRGLEGLRSLSSPFLAFCSGASSGFSGTSGPLKGVAIRNLNLDRHHMVGAASLASFAGDATKTAVFAEAQLLGRESLLVAAAAVPLMIAGTWTGKTLNSRVGERGYAVLFWSVMGGYSVRIALQLL